MDKKTYSNPLKDEEKEFKYIPGKFPYHVFVKQRHWIALSIMIFADSEEDALQIVKNIVLFFRKKHARYIKKNDGHFYGPISDRVAAIEGSIKGETIKISRIDQGQVYKIGWADNDEL